MCIRDRGLLDELATPTRVIDKADLVALAIDRPEVAALHLARPGTAGFDWRLVHGLDPAPADRNELGRKDRFEQGQGGVRQLREPRARDLDACLLYTSRCV